ncbi:hypothetical protein GO986_21790 [Deinococcus sp. HMF7620]|uniref:Uncharacterized protein n=1 Tax=Deinococcus arboris TaxID=2682977 RepID=A0A7C9I5Z6_9DEIO|nr:hypothetical protein [Deinococcus arboris]MVN89371.1 hypothetical protein [Deinococcus arboris]
MTKKKFDTGHLLIAGGVLAAVAVAAVVLTQPGAQAAGEEAAPGSFWNAVPDFSVHNGLTGNGYGSVWQRWVEGLVPGNPLAPRPGGLYGPTFSDKYGHYDTPSVALPEVEAPTGSFTKSGSTGGFGVSAGGYYK